VLSALLHCIFFRHLQYHIYVPRTKANTATSTMVLPPTSNDDEVTIPAASIATSPNEIVLRILAFVPYSMAQHATLRLVSRLFKNVVVSNALRLAVVRCQYPVLAAPEDQ